MYDLPPELTDRISSFLDYDDLKRTLFVSPPFQAAAERYSGAFAEFIFKNDDDDCKKFLSTYGGRRLRYLRYIEVHTNFPALQPWDIDPDDLPCRESRAELSLKDESFTEQVQRVFRIIKLAEYEASIVRHGAGRIQLTVLTPTRLVDPCFCRHRVSSAWRIHLHCPESFPELSSIRGLSICNPEVNSRRDGDRYAMSRLDQRVLIDLASRLPNLEYLGSRLGVEEGRLPDADPVRKHFEYDFEACARNSRSGFAKAFEEVRLPPSLRYLQLDFLNNLGGYVQLEEGGGPNLVSPSSYDVFSSSLRVFASNLRRLEVRLMADSTLFWPLQGDASFPHLEVLGVMFHPMSPTGSWYFHGVDGEGKDDIGYRVTDDMYPPLDSGDPHDADWHFQEILGAIDSPVYFRQVPNEKKLYPFLGAFAKAASNMHALKAFSLWSPLAQGAAWGIAYARPGEYATLSSPSHGFQPTRQLWWKVGQWRPSPALHRLFQNIGIAQHGEQVLEHWNDEGDDDGLTDQQTFTESRPAHTTYAGEYPAWNRSSY